MTTLYSILVQFMAVPYSEQLIWCTLFTCVRLNCTVVNGQLSMACTLTACSLCLLSSRGLNMSLLVSTVCSCLVQKCPNLIHSMLTTYLTDLSKVFFFNALSNADRVQWHCFNGDYVQRFINTCPTVILSEVFISYPSNGDHVQSFINYLSNRDHVQSFCQWLCN